MMKRKLATAIAAHRNWTPVRLLSNGCRKFIRAAENASYNLSENGEEHVLQRLASCKSTPILTVFDIGANVGDWSAQARRFLPNAIIHCFELSPATTRSLSERFCDDGRLVINPVGLSNTNGRVTFHYYPENTRVSSLLPYPHGYRSVTCEGSVMRGDDYTAKAPISQIDLMKIDVEGSEHLVLQGFQSTLHKRAISVIQFEYGTANILSGHLLYDHYRMLEDCGYRVGKIYPAGVDFRSYRFEHEDFIGPNYLAVLQEKKDILDCLT